MHTTTTQEQIAANVREVMEEQGRSRTELAQRLNVHYRQALRIVNGESRIRFDYLKSIGSWLGVDPRSFLGLPVSDADTWLTVRECGATAKRHPETIRKAIRAGDLPSTQRVPGGMHLVRASDLNAWIAGVR